VNALSVLVKRELLVSELVSKSKQMSRIVQNIKVAAITEEILNVLTTSENNKSCRTEMSRKCGTASIIRFAFDFLSYLHFPFGDSGSGRHLLSISHSQCYNRHCSHHGLNDKIQ